MANQTATILVVDDQPTIYQVLKGLLFHENYELLYLPSGLALLNQIGNIKPDTILLDVMMPGMDGFEVCRQLKANEQWQHIPIILVTALDSKENIAEGLNAGADDFITKPVNSLELQARIRSMLRIKRQFDKIQTMMQLREDLTTMIVHDIRNPLTPIMGLAELLLMTEPLSPQGVKDLQVISHQAHRLNEYLNDLLTLAKMEKGELLLNRSRLDLNQILQTVQQNYHTLAQSKEIDLITHYTQTGPPFLADSNLFQRVLDNLVSNALKFSPAHSKILVEAESFGSEASSNPTFRLKVIDEGPGIPEDYHNTIFDKFKVVDLYRKDIPQTGIGLAFCKLVVEAHGGRIFVNANATQGSTFTVEI